MNAISMAVIFALLVFAAGGVGLELQRRLPESFTTGSSRDTIGAISGLLGLFLALVLGLLIWTSYGVYSTPHESPHFSRDSKKPEFGIPRSV